MELGQRLKEARLACGLSQRELCGDTITRNMLSQIESGRAKPSMDTLRYLSARLGKPMGYFLEEEAVLSPNQHLLADARGAYEKGRYRQALTILEDYKAPDVFDGEQQVLQTICLLELSRQALREDRKPYARDLLHRIQDGFYHLPALMQERDLLLSQAGEDAPIPSADAILLIKAQKAFLQQDYVKSEIYLEAVDQKDAAWHLLRGQTAVALGNYEVAAAYLHKAEETYPKDSVPLLEQCYKEMEDYKMAYQYACKRAGL